MSLLLVTDQIVQPTLWVSLYQQSIIFLCNSVCNMDYAWFLHIPSLRQRSSHLSIELLNCCVSLRISLLLSLFSITKSLPTHSGIQYPFAHARNQIPLLNTPEYRINFRCSFCTRRDLLWLSSGGSLLVIMSKTCIIGAGPWPRQKCSCYSSKACCWRS